MNSYVFRCRSYERVPHVTLNSIADNAEIDAIWDKWQQALEPIREKRNAALGRSASRHALEGGHPVSSKSEPSKPLDPRLRGNDSKA